MRSSTPWSGSLSVPLAYLHLQAVDSQASPLDGKGGSQGDPKNKTKGSASAHVEGRAGSCHFVIFSNMYEHMSWGDGSVVKVHAIQM